MRTFLFKISGVLFLASQKKVGLQNSFLSPSVKAASQYFVSLTLFIFLLFLNISCAEKKIVNDYEKLFLFKVIIDQANKNRITPVNACISKYQVARDCLQSSTEFSSIQLTEANVSRISTLPQNRFSNYNDLCNNEVTDLGQRLSETIKVCIMNCGRSYFLTRRNLNICSVSSQEILEGQIKDVGSSNCRADCFRVSGNNP